MAMRPQMNLGQLIDALKRQPQDEDLRFDFVYFAPTGLHSYRGDYSQLAIGYEAPYPKKPMKVKELLAECEDAVGKEFTGYKGGEYIMGRETYVWVANPNEAGRTGVVNVRSIGIDVIIETEAMEG